MGRLSLSVGLEKGPERELKTVSFSPKLHVILDNSADPEPTPRSGVSDLGLPMFSQGFTDTPLYTVLWCQSDKKSAAINYLDFIIHTRGLISLINDNHVDKTTVRKFWCMYTIVRL